MLLFLWFWLDSLAICLHFSLPSSFFCPFSYLLIFVPLFSRELVEFFHFFVVSFFLLLLLEFAIVVLFFSLQCVLLLEKLFLSCDHLLLLLLPSLPHLSNLLNSPDLILPLQHFLLLPFFSFNPLLSFLNSSQLSYLLLFLLILSSSLHVLFSFPGLILPLPLILLISSLLVFLSSAPELLLFLLLLFIHLLFEHGCLLLELLSFLRYAIISLGFHCCLDLHQFVCYFKFLVVKDSVAKLFFSISLAQIFSYAFLEKGLFYIGYALLRISPTPGRRLGSNCSISATRLFSY